MTTKVKYETKADFLIITRTNDDDPREALIALNKRAESAISTLYARCPAVIDNDDGVGLLRSIFGLTAYMKRSRRRVWCQERGFTVEHAFV